MIDIQSPSTLLLTQPAGVLAHTDHTSSTLGSEKMHFSLKLVFGAARLWVVACAFCPHLSPRHSRRVESGFLCHSRPAFLAQVNADPFARTLSMVFWHNLHPTTLIPDICVVLRVCVCVFECAALDCVPHEPSGSFTRFARWQKLQSVVTCRTRLCRSRRGSHLQGDSINPCEAEGGPKLIHVAGAAFAARRT